MRNSMVVRGVVPALGLCLALVLGAACPGGTPPVFEAPKALGERVVMLEPELRLPDRLTRQPTDRDLVETSLTRRLRQALAGKGIGFSEPEEGGEAVAAIRSNLLEAWRSQRTQSARRMRVGARVKLPPGAAAMRAAGARSAVLPILSGRTAGADGDDYAPLPPQQGVHWLPEERSDYEVPTAGEKGMTSGVDLDLVIVDLETGEIVAHRRVIHPAADASDIIGAMPVMVREVTRNLQAL
jgi:hypothetical protein